jgi:hypothetical protein
MVALLFWGALIAAYFDWRYVRAGGVRPTRDDYRYLGYGVALCVVTLVGLGLLGGNAGALGNLTAFLVSVMFAMWEWRRYRIRRANRVAPPLTAN